MKQQKFSSEEKEEEYRIKRLVSRISPPYRRLDILANMFQGKSKAAALCFDGINLKIALNEERNSELFRKLSEYLKKVATVNYEVPGFISRLNEEKIKLLKYVDAQNTDHKLNGWIRRFKTNLLRVEGSIHAYKILENPGLKRVFRGNEYRAEVAFSKEIVEAMDRGFQYVPAINGMHAELKLAQDLLYNNLDQLNAGQKFYIATSKKCCRNCEAAIAAINEVFSEPANITAAPRYSYSTALPGRYLSIATKESLVGIEGSQETYPSPIPSFMSPDSSHLDEVLREKIILFFLQNLRKNSRTDLTDLFNEGANRGRHNASLLHSFSLSPTYRITESRAEEQAPLSFTQKLSAEYSHKITKPIAQTLTVSTTDKKETQSIDLGEEINIEPLDIAEKSSSTKKPKTASSKKKKKGKVTKSKTQNKVKSTETDGDWETTEEMMEQNSIDQPIIIFYERPNDSSAADMLISSMDDLKASDIGTLAPYDSEVNSTYNLKSHYRRIVEKLSKTAKETPSGQDRDQVNELLKIYMSNYRLVVKAEKENMTVSNIAMGPGELERVIRTSKSNNAEINDKINEIIASTPSLSAATSNEELKHAMCHNAEIMQIYEDSLLNPDTQSVGVHLARNLARICKTTEKGVVTIVEWNKAKVLEDTLKDLSCNNVTSFFIFRTNPLDQREESNLNINMLRYNQDFTNSVAMSNTTIIDAANTTTEELKARLSECIRPVTIAPLVEYEPPQQKAGEWEERISRSQSPEAKGKSGGH